MILAFPSAQLSSNDPSTNPTQNVLVQTTGVGIPCSTGVTMLDFSLPASSSNVPIPFPPGVSTASVLMVLALTAADLTVNVSGVQLQVPALQAILLYNVASSTVSLSSATGGSLQMAIGG